MKPRKIVLMGFMSRIPVAGVVWQHLHYVAGFRKVGCEVIYLEDTLSWPYDARQLDQVEDPTVAAEFTKAMAERFHFRWGFRASYREPAETFGMSDADFVRAIQDADAVLNICGAQELTERVRKAKCLVYVESDPGVEQIKLAKKTQDTIDFLSAHHARFTFGENLGQADCPVPMVEGFSWHPTRQPIVTEWWRPEKRRAKDGREPFRFTSVANWETKGKDIVWKNKVYYWSKTFEFLKFADVPRAVAHRSPIAWELATDMRQDPASLELFGRQGWKLESPHEMSADPFLYQRYVQGSDAEWTVAKDQYVRWNTGWFSDRSACYLAAGLPVITQNTGFSKIIPVGEGLFDFRGVPEIQTAVDIILSDPAKHSKAASDLAREYFEAEKVCAGMLERLGL
ncbi:MAG: hypothetical protein JO317_08950 [Verrucomicrobiae bacterium]|nr:hypothetical protein [Verrucomicrobiae bacterium]